MECCIIRSMFEVCLSYEYVQETIGKINSESFKLELFLQPFAHSVFEA